MIETQAKRYARVIAQLFLRRHIVGNLKTVNRGARHLSYGLRLSNSDDLSNALKLAENIALASNSKSVIAQRQAGYIVYQFELKQQFWQSYTRQDLESQEAIGLAEKREMIKFQFSDSFPHSLFAGTTGSGKTEAIKSTLISLMTVYKPNELKLVICDPVYKFTDFDNEVHLAMPIARDNQEMQSALQYCYNEFLNRRRGNIKDAAILCLVFDEVTESLFNDADFEMLRTLVKQGRNYHIHCIVGTQKPSQKDLPGIVDQLLNRFIGLVANAQTSASLTGHSGLQAHKLTGQGDFIHIAGGLGAKRFQIAQATTQDFNNLERGEIKPVRIIENDVTILPDIKSVGRPKAQVDDFKILAHYFYHGPDNISISQAEKHFDLKLTAHRLYKNAAWEMGKEYKKLWQKRKRL